MEDLSMSQQGFQKYNRLSVDDFPLITPPRQHVLANITAGLSHLYDSISKDKGKRGASDDSNDSVKRGSDKTSALKEKVETKKVDDEGGGFDEDEITPYTNEEGVFVPDNSLTLLASRYKYVEVVAHGQSATIVKALDTFSKDKPVAIKVLHEVYKPIGSQEADILLELHRADPWLHVPFARLQNQFIYGPHYCLVFDFFCPTEQKSIKNALDLSNVRNLCVKLLTVLGFLHKQNVIHADLKPENILLVKEDCSTSVMVIDFGNALRNTEEELSVYYSDYELQTLLYRAPEVIFGLKLGLEIDMWSLGCILAECLTGEPLFIGQTKEEVLVKMTELLGPLPKEFSAGDYSEMFSTFIGEPLSRFQRVENLRQKLNNCPDINFLFLLESLLTYSPSKRPSPFEATCHSFLANVNPFLYLNSSQDQKRYPKVLLDTSTYPFLPSIPEEASLDPVSKGVSERLFAYSAPSSKVNGLGEDVAKVDSVQKETTTEDKAKNSSVPSIEKLNTHSEPASPKCNNVESVTEESPAPPKSIPERPKTPVTPASVNDSLSVEENSDAEVSISKDENVSSQDDVSVKKPVASRAKGQKQPENSNVTRTDVKQTLKSMGLRCEDFTISVYSKEQAHAILKKQGVEVTNHVPPRRPQPRMGQPQPRHVPAVRPMKFNRQNPNFNPYGRPMNSGIIRPMPNRPRPQPSPAPVKAPPPPAPPSKSAEDDDDDDDDCVILDPPEGAPKMPPKPRLPQRRFPQQFQLMGTTVQVNRGSKRPMRSMQYAPMSKRHQSRFYNDYSHDDNSEASVQDTLKRLKNYNISITCRKNSAQRPSRMPYPMDSDSEMDYGGRGDSEDEEEDMARFLECKIDEDRLGYRDEEDEEDEYFNVDSSSSYSGSPCKERRNVSKGNPGNSRDKNKLNSTVELEEDEIEDREEMEGIEEEEEENPNENGVKEDEEGSKEPSADSNPETGMDGVPPESSDQQELEESTKEDASKPEEESPVAESPAEEEPQDESPEPLPEAVEDKETDEPQEEPVNDDLPEEPEQENASPTEEGDEGEDLPTNTDEAEDSKPEKDTKDVCDNLDDDINEELEEQLLQATNIDDEDDEAEDMDALEIGSEL